jgi:hypothetical protein
MDTVELKFGFTVPDVPGSLEAGGSAGLLAVLTAIANQIEALKLAGNVPKRILLITDGDDMLPGVFSSGGDLDRAGVKMPGCTLLLEKSVIVDAIIIQNLAEGDYNDPETMLNGIENEARYGLTPICRLTGDLIFGNPAFPEDSEKILKGEQFVDLTLRQVRVGAD